MAVLIVRVTMTMLIVRGLQSGGEPPLPPGEQ